MVKLIESVSLEAAAKTETVVPKTTNTLNIKRIRELNHFIFIFHRMFIFL